MNSWQFGGVTLYQGNCMDVLPTLPAESVQACIMSPPYWGLRDYGTARWEGGEAGCDHSPGNESRVGRTTLEGGTATTGHKQEPYHDTCRKCGAIRIDQQLGLERVPDCLGWATKQPCGECYVCHTVAWAREVRRVLRGDGVMWLVLGDSYAGGRTGRADVERLIDGIGPNSHGGGNAEHIAPNWGIRPVPDGLKPKDLVGIPWRVALALQADGWWLRSDVIWAKPNPMPESVTDRPTKAHEYVFILAKSQRYYWDAEAVKEHNADPTRTNFAHGAKMDVSRNDTDRMDFGGGNGNGRNLRTVWNIATQPYAGAHFAVFPEKLVEPMVKAATSERGCCPRCGKAWERVTGDKEPAEGRGSDNIERKIASEGERSRLNTHLGSSVPWSPTTTPTVGWQPACTCDAGDPIPCTILDPFGGSGTVASVALRLGRRAILCELNPDYIELQKERIEQTQPALEGMAL